MRIRERRYLGKTDAQWEAFCQNIPTPPSGMIACVCHGRVYGHAERALYKLNESQRRRHRRKQG